MFDILYIHGFLSSPQSAKATLMRQWAESHPDVTVHIPALPVDPQAALTLLESIVQQSAKPLSLIGSSLGGFYANVLSAKYQIPAVLINPAVHPHQLLKKYVGVQENYHTGIASEVRPEHFEFLENIEVSPRYPSQILVLLETGDETLDYQLAEQFYVGCHLDITKGGSHSYEGFAEKLPSIIAFLNKKL